MIVSVWKPRFKNLNGVKNVNFYELVDTNLFLTEKKQGWIVNYTCDKCLSNTIESTTSHVLFNPKNRYNTINEQTCRKCRSRISEYEIKQNFIPFKVIYDSIITSKYEVLTTESEYMSSDKRSQFKFNVICDSGHSLPVTWNNWSQGKRCGMCYKQNKWGNAVKNKNGWVRYKFLVWYYTELSYRNYKDLINPDNYKRGSDYHLDHKYSLYEGFKNNVSPKIIGGYKNLEVIESFKNLSKGKKCSIELSEINKLI
jgi:hypothetical protein